jgi:hypothetical protein
LDITDNCPDIQTLYNYYSKNLKNEDRNALEEHLFVCRDCIWELRQASMYFEKMKLMEANPLLGKAYAEIGDYLEVKAASDLDKSKVKEFLTKNKKFKIILRPLEDNPGMSLLELELLDHSTKGTVNICIGRTNKKAEIDDNYSACFLVDSSIDLSRLFIILC